jgi:crossover junction endodeoxyribonuclease RuvC
VGLDRRRTIAVRTPGEFDVRVLGVDPGLGCTGYGLVESQAGRLRIREAGAIRSQARAELPDRLAQIHAAILEELYSEYDFPRTALLMAHARGAICLAAAQHQIPVWGFPPSEVKNAVVGHGRASKEQVQEMVQRLFGLPQRPTPNDVADALAIAVTGVYRAPGHQSSAKRNGASALERRSEENARGGRSGRRCTTESTEDTEGARSSS